MDDRHAKLMLVDDHEVVRAGLADLLATEERFLIVGEAGSVAGAVAEARRCKPDVILMDVRLPDGSGVDACREIKSDLPDTRVLILTSHSAEEAVVAAVVAGAAGFHLKDADPDSLIEAISVVARGGSLIDPAVSQAVIRWMREQGRRSSACDPVGWIGVQERKILPLIADGKTNREIASELFLSEHTVKTYICSILRKLNLFGAFDTTSVPV